MMEEISVTLTGFKFIKDGQYPDDFEVCLLILEDGQLSAGCWDTGLLSTEYGKKQGCFRQSRGGVIDANYVIAWVPLEHQDKINQEIENKRKTAEIEETTDFESIDSRIRILEAIIWAQEHHNQIMYLSDTAENSVDFRNQLMEKYSFDEKQSQAIMDMRSKEYTIQEKMRVKEELHMLLCKGK